MQVRWEKQVDAMAAGLKTTSEAFGRDTVLTFEEESATGAAIQNKFAGLGKISNHCVPSAEVDILKHPGNKA